MIAISLLALFIQHSRCPIFRDFKRQRNGRDDMYRREDYDNYQPVMMTFKAFLSTQDDSITDEEALHKYSEYKIEFQRQQLNEFFVSHKEDEWFKLKYQPDMKSQRLAEMKEMLSKRLNVFSKLITDDFMEDMAVDDSHQDKLIELMDTVIESLFILLTELANSRDSNIDLNSYRL